MKLLASLFAVSVLVSGCVTGSHVITGQARPAINPSAVKIYPALPEKFEPVGNVYATADGDGQRANDKAVAKLKLEAGKIGANGIVLSHPVVSGDGMWTATGTQFSAQAIFVP